MKAISKEVVFIISPFLIRLYRRSSYLRYNQYKHCGFVSIVLQLRLVRGDSNHSDLSELVISKLTLDVSIFVNTWTSFLWKQQCKFQKEETNVLCRNRHFKIQTRLRHHR